MFALCVVLAIIQTGCAVPMFDPAITTEMTTTTTTGLPTTTRPNGCVYNGLKYPIGSHQLGDDRSTNWCYGIVCGPDGGVYSWDNFNCHPTTYPPTTTTLSPPTDPPKGCVYQGQFYLDNTVIQESLDKNGNPCDVTFCNSKGVLVHKHNSCALVG